MRFTRFGTDFLPKTLRFIHGKSIRCYIHYELTDHAVIRRLIQSRSSQSFVRNFHILFSTQYNLNSHL